VAGFDRRAAATVPTVLENQTGFAILPTNDEASHLIRPIFCQSAPNRAPLAPAMIQLIRTESPGRLGGRPLDDWNAAYGKVEGYFHALGVRNKLLLGQLVALVLERAMARATQEPARSTTELAVAEMDHLVNEWFAQVLQDHSAGADMLSTRGRLALLLADMSGKWQDQFLRPGPWPPEFVSAMRETYLRAGPDFQTSKMAPRPLNLGPIATLTQIGRLPYARMAATWLLFVCLLVLLFILTHH
jgi:hypothetical protein